MSVYVFLGPSLSLDDARHIVDARFLPPVAVGDVRALVDERPHAIAIIDGLFRAIPSVWHKEILYALSRGVPVFGASSMGALRAAELHAYGMIGIGRVFEMYRDGVLEDDDEVAVVHGPASMGHRPVSEAMVNLRDGLERAARAGAIRDEVCHALVAASKARFFVERTWTHVDDDARTLATGPEREALRNFVATEKPNLKRDDAIACLQRLAAEMARGLAPHQPSFDFHPTRFFRELELRTKHRRARDDSRALAVHVRATRRAEVLDRALVLDLLGRAREQFDVVADPAAIAAAVERLHGADLPDADLRELATAEVVRDSLAARWSVAIDARVRLALASRGELSEVEAHLSRRAAVLAAHGLEAPEWAQLGIDLEGLLAWHRRRTETTLATLEELAAGAGLSARTFLDELLREYAFETLSPR